MRYRDIMEMANAANTEQIAALLGVFRKEEHPYTVRIYNGAGRELEQLRAEYRNKCLIEVEAFARGILHGLRLVYKSVRYEISDEFGDCLHSEIYRQ